MDETLRGVIALVIFAVIAAGGLTVVGRYSIREGERLAPTYDDSAEDSASTEGPEL